MKLVWDATGEKIAEAGIKNGVLFPMVGGAYGAGVAWNGLTSVGEAPTGAEASPFYADNQKYLEIMSAEEFAGTIGCYTYPDAFKSCVGEGALTTGIYAGQQTHTKFGFSYRTEMVNDTDGVDFGYKIHLVYDCMAEESDYESGTINDSPELSPFEFNLTGIPITAAGLRPTSYFSIDSREVSDILLRGLEHVFYGKGGTAPTLPSIADIRSYLAA